MLNKTVKFSLLLFSLSGYAAPTVLEVIPLFNRPASELQPLIQPLLENTDHVVSSDFSLIIRTTPARLVEIKALIKKLDLAPINLTIRVIQSKDKTAEQMNAGANIGVTLPIDNPATIKGNVDGYFQQNQQHQTSNSEQLLRTIEGKPAYIKAGSNNPIRYTTVYNSGYGQSSVATNTQYVEATTGFSVLPRLNGDQVMLEISPWSDQMKSNGNIETQSAQATLKTKLGEWVEIGSISEQSHSTGSGLLSSEQASGQNTIHILVQVEKTH